MTQSSSPKLVRIVLGWLAILGVISLACSDPNADDYADAGDVGYEDGNNHSDVGDPDAGGPGDPDMGTVDPNALQYCELVQCWIICEDGACVDACFDAASAEAVAQDQAFDACIDSCDHIEDEQEWLDCISDTCPEEEAAFEACFEPGTDPPIADDPTICQLYRCYAAGCFDDEACLSECEDNSTDQALAEYEVLRQCRTNCMDENADGGRDYDSCMDEDCPEENALFVHCLNQMGGDPEYTCGEYFDCKDWCWEYQNDCMIDCEEDDFGCYDDCGIAQDDCDEVCLDNVSANSLDILMDLNACIAEECPNGDEYGECSEEHCPAQAAACWND